MLERKKNVRKGIIEGERWRERKDVGEKKTVKK